MNRSIFLILTILVFATLPVMGQVDYQTEIQPIFNSNCTSCHGGLNGVTLSSYQSVMNSNGTNYGQIVVPGDPGGSPLVQKLSPNPPIGDRMPQGGPFLSNEQINLISTWINEGANEVPTSIEQPLAVIQKFSLLSNYPNPFNPTTNLRLEAPQSGSFTLTVQSITGSVVEERDVQVTAGINEFSLSLNQQASGIYLYTFSNADIVLSGKVILLK
jgi:mono/diheme cytochrome c family protein